MPRSSAARSPRRQYRALLRGKGYGQGDHERPRGAGRSRGSCSPLHQACAVHMACLPARTRDDGALRSSTLPNGRVKVLAAGSHGAELPHACVGLRERGSVVGYSKSMWKASSANPSCKRRLKPTRPSVHSTISVPPLRLEAMPTESARAGPSAVEPCVSRRLT